MSRDYKERGQICLFREKSKNKRKLYYLLVVIVVGICILFLIILNYNTNFIGRTDPDIIEGTVLNESILMSIKIDSWTPEGFKGYIKSDPNGIFEDDTFVNVVFEKDVKISYSNGDIFQYTSKNPNAEECMIEPESIVSVEVYKYESAGGNLSDQLKIYVSEVMEK